jgi:hypothetical protein
MDTVMDMDTVMAMDMVTLKVIMRMTQTNQKRFFKDLTH